MPEVFHDVMKFLSTPSARRATAVILVKRHFRDNFYPRPPRGGRPAEDGANRILITFLSTPSARRATSDTKTTLRTRTFLSTPSARRATLRAASRPQRTISFLSTPSARRATPFRRPRGSRTRNFYPRPPRGGRPRSCTGRAAHRPFLSTPSARRATLAEIVR